MKKKTQKKKPVARGEPWPLPFPVVDLELTGLDPERHGILSIGAWWERSGHYGKHFYVECRPWRGAAYDPAAMVVNGQDRRQVETRETSEEEAVLRFLSWMGGPAAIGGMNPAACDVPFLRAAIGRLQRWLCHRTVDMHALAVGHAAREGLAVPARGFATDEIYELLGMAAEPRPHHALTGAKAEAIAIGKLLHGKTQ